MVDISDPQGAVADIIVLLNGDFSQNNLIAVLTGTDPVTGNPVFSGLNPGVEADSITINVICGLLFQILKAQNNLTTPIIFNVMQALFNSLGGGVEVSDYVTFFGYFCKFFNSQTPTENCSCFNDFVLGALKANNFDVSFKTAAGMKNFGTAIGLNAHIQNVSITQCLKNTPQRVNGTILGYALQSYFNFQQSDFLVTCDFYMSSDLRVKLVGPIIKELLDQQILGDSSEALSDVFCDILKTWEFIGFNFCPKSLADFLMIQTQVSRCQFEELKVQIYSCLNIPALKDIYLKIGPSVEIDLSRFVINDSMAFVYTINTNNTRGQIKLNTGHPPAAPVVRYRMPQLGSNCRNFKDSFEVIVKNTINDYTASAIIFLALDA